MKNQTSWLMTGLGLVLLLLGGWQMHSAVPLTYLCIGVGAGLFGQGTGELVSLRALKHCPEVQRELEIAQKDERNRTIADRAKSKAFDAMTFAFAALMLSFALMKVEMSAVLMMVIVYLLVEGYAVYWRIRYEKEM